MFTVYITISIYLKQVETWVVCQMQDKEYFKRKLSAVRMPLKGEIKW